MRPKVVISILVAAFGLLGLIALFKGVAGKSPGGGESQSVSTAPPANSAVANASPTTGADNSNAVAVSPELHQAVIDKEIEQIQELQGEVDGTNNPIIINALLEKIQSPDHEVRAAALQALRELNDTNAVPGLQIAVQNTSDPREKVALLDAIDYIKMPDATANVPPELFTNTASHLAGTNRVNSTNRPHHYNPLFLNGANNNSQRPAAQNTAAGQPQ